MKILWKWRSVSVAAVCAGRGDPGIPMRVDEHNACSRGARGRAAESGNAAARLLDIAHSPAL